MWSSGRRPADAVELELGVLEATLPPLPTARDAGGTERNATPTPEPEDES